MSNIPPSSAAPTSSSQGHASSSPSSTSSSAPSSSSSQAPLGSVAAGQQAASSSPSSASQPASQPASIPGLGSSQSVVVIGGPTNTDLAPTAATPQTTGDSRRISLASLSSISTANTSSSSSSLAPSMERLVYPQMMPSYPSSVASSSTLIEPSLSSSTIHFPSTPSIYGSPKFSEEDETTNLNSNLLQQQQSSTFETPISSPSSRPNLESTTVTPTATMMRLTPPSSLRPSIPNQKPIQYQYPSPIYFSRAPTPIQPSAAHHQTLKLNKKIIGHHNHFRNNLSAFKSRRHINNKKKGSLTYSSPKPHLDSSNSVVTAPPLNDTNFNQHSNMNNLSMDTTPVINNDTPVALFPNFSPAARPPPQTTASSTLAGPLDTSTCSSATSSTTASPSPSSNISTSSSGTATPVNASTPPAHQVLPDLHNIPPEMLPPVNINSLREIDLQEIIKNPQLRHDIVFDPQLQFRPNLDGERGKRKKASTEYYWTSVVAECESLALASTPEEVAAIVNNPQCKLPYLFITLRDILNSLLPAHDHQTVDEVLDLELLMQQLRTSTLDFSALANWLAGIFKAHCAPMRDYWVDQMVARVEQGVENRSPRRIVEGLRMMFAILEAMKLDVANHQIRTLRSVMVESAIDFEQDYYTQMVEKNKFDLQDSLQWYTNNLNKYLGSKARLATASTTDGILRRSPETYRSAFVYGTAMLMSCASDDAVTEFPSTFGFDFARLAGFRAEVRQIVCLHLSVSLFRELLTLQLNKKPGLTNMMRRRLLNQATTVGEIDKMKQQVLAIVADSYGNAKWTKNTSILALEIARCVEVACTPLTAERAALATMIPPEDAIDMASNWLFKHLQPKSMLYKLVETKVINALVEVCSKSMSTFSTLDQVPSLSNSELTAAGSGNGAVATTAAATAAASSSQPPNNVNAPASISPEVCGRKEILEMGSKALVLLHFHWGVFSKFYVHYASLGENEDLRSQYSSSSLSEDSSSSGDVPRTKRNNANAAAVLASKKSADNEITQSL